MENWCWEREAIALISGHYQSGEPLPEELFQRMVAARTSNRECTWCASSNSPCSISGCIWNTSLRGADAYRRSWTRSGKKWQCSGRLPSTAFRTASRMFSPGAMPRDITATNGPRCCPRRLCQVRGERPSIARPACSFWLDPGAGRLPRSHGAVRRIPRPRAHHRRAAAPLRARCLRRCAEAAATNLAAGVTLTFSC